MEELIKENMEKQSSKSIIITALVAILCLLVGMLLGDVMNKYVLHDGFTPHRNVAIVFACVFVIAVIVWAIVRIKKHTNYE